MPLKRDCSLRLEPFCRKLSKQIVFYFILSPELVRWVVYLNFLTLKALSRGTIDIARDIMTWWVRCPPWAAWVRIPPRVGCIAHNYSNTIKLGKGKVLSPKVNHLVATRLHREMIYGCAKCAALGRLFKVMHEIREKSVGSILHCFFLLWKPITLSLLNIFFKMLFGYFWYCKSLLIF